ncbi:MAG: YqeG family HAD IIIA-type phosphatase [Clostridia bacterium]|nr:YqeG family HAD IIIA-type phosphatase [Clostridia bacterium]
MKLKEMGEDFSPQYIFRTIADVTPETLLAAGVKAAAVDIDNTLAYDSTLTLFPDAKDWVRRMRDAGIPLIILTNTYRLRAKTIGKKLGLPYICKANKPEPEGYVQCARQLGVDVSALAMIGDQLRTDVRGANNAGAVSVLVRPRHREILVGIYYYRIRRLENIYLKNHGLL